ncbi:MAG: hypothetical protein CO039_04675 [Candidatus Pacebacteria bacterium CG_4_9_14_0_2_um_filter_34_50]|nr:MAG: hypothetical protein CO039_04675 [Candidatus Pacebacteria bacterium CG_4_9_14_0_2_um_filter_34_50]
MFFTRRIQMKSYLKIVSLVCVLSLVVLTACTTTSGSEVASDAVSAIPSGVDVGIGESVADVVETGPSGSWTAVTTADQTFDIGGHRAIVRMSETGSALQIEYRNLDGTGYKYFFVEVAYSKPSGFWYIVGDTSYDFGSHPDWYARFGVGPDLIYARNVGVWEISP